MAQPHDDDDSGAPTLIHGAPDPAEAATTLVHGPPDPAEAAATLVRAAPDPARPAAAFVTLASPVAPRGRFEADRSAGTPVAVDAPAWSPESAAFDQRYEARAVLGEGGMGEVRLCRDHLVGRDVALKVMQPGAAAHVESRERFVREARVQGQLEHPAIVPVYDLGVAPRGYAYFTMKRIRGRTLDEIIKLLAAGDAAAAAKYTRRRLLTAFGSVCQAIDFAHQRGVLHRDLKPSNVILGDHGEVYVLDWGLAKAAGVEDRVGEAVDDLPSATGRTLQGTLLGTPGYMAPEQARGEPLDHRADLFAAGIVLWELLAGRRFLRAESDAGAMHKLLYEPLPSLAEVRPSLDPLVIAVVERAMCREMSITFSVDWGRASSPLSMDTACRGWRRS